MPAAGQQLIEIDGRGSLVSNVSQHGGETQDFTVFTDIITDHARRIRKREGKVAVGSSAGGAITSLHEFARNNSGVVTHYQFRTFGTTIQRLIAGTWTTETITDPDTAATAVFTGTAWNWCNFNNRCFLVNGTDPMYVYDGTAWKQVGVTAPIIAPTYNLDTNDPPYQVGTVTIVKGSKAVTGAGGTVWTAAMVGKRITINGFHYVIESRTSNTVIGVTEALKENGASGLTYFIYVGAGDWDIGPKYGYSYYNPTTGHVSNVSPLIQITQQNQFGRSVTLTVAGDASHTKAYQNGFTKIQWFRTAKNGTVLVALNEKADNNNAGTALTYVENETKFRDTYLTSQEAPLVSNRKPDSGLAYLAAHQGRLWAWRPSDGKLYFTPISVEVDFGVAAECWPAKQSRDLAEVSGMLNVGATSGSDSLVIQTTKGDFGLDGIDSRTFTTFLLPTRRSGGFNWGATSVDGRLVQFYRDKRLMIGNQDLGLPIQDKLNAIANAYVTGSRLHWFAFNSRNYLLLSVPAASGSTVNNVTYVFDLDDEEGAWYQWGTTSTTCGFSAFATVHTSGALELWAGDSTGAVYNLLTAVYTDAGTNIVPTFKTSLIRPAEAVYADVRWIKIYVSDAGVTWTGKLYIDEQTNSGATDGTVTSFTFAAARHDAQSAQGRELVYVFPVGQRSRASVFQLEVTFPSDTTALYIDKIVIAYDVPQTVPVEL